MIVQRRETSNEKREREKKRKNNSLNKIGRNVYAMFSILPYRKSEFIETKNLNRIG